MRLIGWLLLLLVVFAWVASEVPLRGDSPQPSPEVAWRRTADGWEKTARWHNEPAVRRPALHPMVVALLQMLLALGALIAFSRNDSDTARREKRRLNTVLGRHARTSRRRRGRPAP